MSPAPRPRPIFFVVIGLLFAAWHGLLSAPARAEYDDIYYKAANYGPEKPLGDIIEKRGLPLDSLQHLTDTRVEIDKSSRRLRLFCGDSLIKTYRIQLGKRPVGAKARRGDGRTPEGSYRICTHNKWSRYYLSLQIDYPNEHDIAVAVEQRRISQAQAQALRDEMAAGKCPSGRTRLGGEVFIHGQLPKITRQIRREKRKPSNRTDLQPGDMDPGKLNQWYDWTLGCIGMTNPDIRELFRYLPDGTPVEIHP